MLKKIFAFVPCTPPPPAPPLRPPAPPILLRASRARVPSALPPPVLARRPEIVGKWKEPRGNDRTEFCADGSVIECAAGGEAIHGRYSLQGKNLRVQLEGVPEELFFTIALQEDALEMIDGDGSVSRYQRV